MPRRTRSRSDDPLRLQLCLALCAMEFGADALALGRPDARGPLVDFARQVAMRLAHTSFGMNHTRIGQLIGRDRSTVAHGCAVIEDECDCPVFAARLDRLERALRTLTTAPDGGLA